MVVQLSFLTFNNEIEYETFLAGLCATKYMGVAKVIIHFDSQLVDQQVARTYEEKNGHLQTYVEIYKKKSQN